jgi:hypothetical protein
MYGIFDCCGIVRGGFNDRMSALNWKWSFGNPGQAVKEYYWQKGTDIIIKG